MGSRLHKAYLLIPVLYAGIIGFFFFMHFSQDAGFTDHIGPITISAHRSGKTDNTRALLNAQVRCNGIEFLFQGQDCVELTYENNTTEKLSLIDYKRYANGIDLGFTKGFILKFMISDNETDSIAVSYVPENDRIRSISFSLRQAAGATVKPVGRLPCYFVQNVKTGFYLNLPAGSQFSVERQVLTLYPGTKQNRQILIEGGLDVKTDPYAYWFGKEFPTADEAAYRKALKTFLDKAYNGWKTARYRAETSSWRYPSEDIVFQENTVAAFLAESIPRNTYDVALAQAKRITEKTARNSLTVFTNPYLGNLINTTVASWQEEALEIEKVRNLIIKRDETVFRKEGLLRFIVDKSLFALMNDMADFAQKASFSASDMQTSIGMLNTFLECKEIMPDSADSFGRFAAIPREILLENSVYVNDGLFIEKEQGRISIKDSISAGAGLLRFGNATNNELMKTAGRVLISSALAWADAETGMLPEILVRKGSKIEGKEGYLLPEDIHPLLTEHGFYPKNVFLGNGAEETLQLYTIADVESFTTTEKQSVITVSFPAGYIHHMTIRGVKPFAEIRLWDIRWKTDPQFQIYSTGWVYDEKTQTLYVKLKHRNNKENIIIRYEKEEPES